MEIKFKKIAYLREGQFLLFHQADADENIFPTHNFKDLSVWKVKSYNRDSASYDLSAFSNENVVLYGIPESLVNKMAANWLQVYGQLSNFILKGTSK